MKQKRGDCALDARERILAFFNGEELDHVAVLGVDTLIGSPGGWVKRLTKRGLGIVRRICPYRPHFNYPASTNLFLNNIRWTNEYYIADGRHKVRSTLATPVGELHSIMGWVQSSTHRAYAREETFVKSRSDWLVLACLFKELEQVITPNYEEIRREEDTLGSEGITLGYLTKTAFPRAWIQLASYEQAVVDFYEKPAELCEFLEAERGFQSRAAEIAAEAPLKVINFYDNITDTISPRIFEEYCIPTYKLFIDALAGTDKLLACHMDGKLAHLRTQIASSPIDVIESMTVPPVGNLPLREAKSLWPEKHVILNCPAHLSYLRQEQIRLEYEKLLTEWGDKKLAIEYVEDLPLEEVEMHLSALLDVCGY